MKKLNRIFKSCVVIILISVCLGGCKTEPIETITFTDNVKIVDTYQQDSYLQPVLVGKMITYITHPAVYQVKVEYNNEKFIFDDFKLYNKYKDEVGKEINATIQQTMYEDNTKEYEVIDIE